MKMTDTDTMNGEYRKSELGKGTRGKHFDAYQASKNLVLLSPDVAAAFPTEDAVNDALRSLIPTDDNTKKD